MLQTHRQKEDGQDLSVIAFANSSERGIDGVFHPP